MSRPIAPAVIVTGGSYGVGGETARELARRGYAVIVVYLQDQAEAEAAVEQILAGNGIALAVRADITDEVDVERLFNETNAAFGAVDAVVHIEVRGTSVVYKEAARQLRHGGAILNVSSSDVISSDLAQDLRARDITINGLTPGLESPGADHDVADLIELLEQWRGSPGD